MKIAIDCRYLGGSGIGKVCEGIIDYLDYTANEFYLIGKKALLEKYEKRGAHVICDDTEPYSLKGLRSFDKKLNKICDLLIVPNFLIPFGVKIPVHAVMYDLIFLDLPKETTRGKRDKLIKKTLLKRCMKRAKTVSCISKFTLSRCEHYYGRLAKKCYVNYVGLSAGILEYAASHPQKEKGDYFVFVGNVKKHKGLEELLQAFSKMAEGSTLKIIGEKENFLTKLNLDESAFKNVVFTGRLKDEEVYEEIRGAKYLIQPSHYEGFGLPPLEALALGTQPILSKIPVFEEIYEGYPVKFFSSIEELIARMREEPAKISLSAEEIDRYSLKDFSLRLLERVKSDER